MSPMPIKQEKETVMRGYPQSLVMDDPYLGSSPFDMGCNCSTFRPREPFTAEAWKKTVG